LGKTGDTDGGWRSSKLLRAAVAASEARARAKTGAGSERGTRGGSASLKKRPGRGEGALPRRAWSGRGCGVGSVRLGRGTEAGERADGRGQVSAAERGEGRRGGSCCSAGLVRSWAGAVARPAQGARGRLSGAGAAARAGPRPEMRRRGRGEGAGLAGGAGRESRKGGRGKKIILFLFPTIFQIHFQLDFEFIWILNQNHSSQK